LTAQPDHDGRYDAADEYMSVVYQLWEASWEDGAVRRDKKNRIFADPAKIHRVRHHGPRYQVDAIHLSEPSLQRTPVLYQAGSSSRGREFAATHAECVFVFGADKRITRDLVADVRSRATAHGRDPKDILIFYNRAVVAGRTRREAEDKYREYHEHASIEGALAHFSSSTGLDFSHYEPDEPIRYVKNDAINSAVETLTTLTTEPWTLRRIVSRMGLGSRNPAIVGSAEEVAEDLISWVDETDIDGFNLSRIVTPEGLEDFVDLVVPILQERGVYKRDYRPGTLREKLFAGSPLLPPSHPAAEPPGRRSPPAAWQRSMNVAHLRNARRCFPVARLRVGVHSKRGLIEFGLGRRLVVEMGEAVGAPRQCRGQPGRPDMMHAGRNVADADTDPPVVAPVRARTVHGQRVVQ